MFLVYVKPTEMQTKIRTYEITPNANICFPIWMVLDVEN